MKFNLETNGQTFTVTTRTDKKATSNYDTQLTVLFENKAIAGCMVKKSESKETVISAAKKCIQMHSQTNWFN